MRISTQFSAAIYTLLLIDYYKDQKVTSSFIGERLNGNPVIYRNLLAKLKEAGFVTIAPGKGKEGTRLAKPLSEITLWDVFIAVEELGVESVFKSYDQFANLSDSTKIISGIIRPIFSESVTAFKEDFSKITLGDIMGEFREKQQDEKSETD